MMSGELGSAFPPYQPRDPDRPTPLRDIVVLDFTHFIAGPLATMILGDLGANVIKIEPPGRGDELRFYPPAHPSVEGLSAPFVWANRNKRSLVLDLKADAAVAAIRELVVRADVLVENFSTGVMERLGLGYNACRAINPRLVYCTMSAYGREGEFADRRGFDPVIQAESGFMSMNGDPDRDGVRSGTTIMDITTGMMAANAIMAALLARETTGEGQQVEVALFDTALTSIGYATLQHLYTGVVPGRWGNASPDTSPTGVFHASDRAFYLSCTTTKLFHKLFTCVVDRPDVAHDPEFQTPAGRLANRERLVGILDDRFRRHDWSHWQRICRDAGVPVGEVRTVADALDSPEAKARGLVTRVEHPRAGPLPNIAMPFRFSETPSADPRPAPTHGGDTRDILRELLGHDETAIDAMAAAGAFGQDKHH